MRFAEKNASQSREKDGRSDCSTNSTSRCKPSLFLRAAEFYPGFPRRPSCAPRGALLLRAMGRVLFGEAHPFSYNSGGSPEGIRLMQPADIKRFHDANYHLGNMGAMVSVPKDMNDWNRF